MGSKLGELLRKSIHMSGVAAVPILYWLGNVKMAVLFFSVALGLYAYPRLVDLAGKTPFGGLLRGFKDALDFLERKSRDRYRGAMLFFVSIGAIALVMPVKIASVSIIVVSIGDGVSTLVGRAFGKNRLFYNRSKSWEGSLSGLAASIFVCSFVASVPMSIFASLVGMFVESFDTEINDNLSVPSSVAMLSYAAVSFGLLPA